ncbi:MAG: hypothetical protein K2L87_00380, partial [Clostridiales bacterium]|nr:hypothetical protein [Clostridiales bacterium]
KELLGAISNLEVKTSSNTSYRAETNAAGGEYTEKVASALDNLNSSLDMQVGALKEELLEAISQVGMAVFNAPDKNDFASFRDQIVKSAGSGASGDYEDKMGVIADNLNERIEAQMSGLKEEMLGAISDIKTAAPVSDGTAKSDAQINYDWLAEKLAQKIPAIDYDFMAERVKEMLPDQLVDYDEIVERVKEVIPEQRIDYDFMAARVKDILPDQPAAEKSGFAASTRKSSADEEPFEIDYDLLAEKIAIIIPEVDYDELADRIANMIPQADENAIADRVASVIPQTDENEIADKVADAIPLVDYDLIAAKVAEKLAEEDLEPSAKTAKQDKVDYDAIAEMFAEKVSSNNN